MFAKFGKDDVIAALVEQAQMTERLQPCWHVGSDPQFRCVFCAFAGGEVHVNKIAVDPSCRRRGIARVLMQEVFDLSTRIRAEEIYLEVRPSNAPARNFYSLLGFREVGRRPQYYADGEDALVMSLFLSPGPSSP